MVRAVLNFLRSNRSDSLGHGAAAVSYLDCTDFSKKSSDFGEDEFDGVANGPWRLELRTLAVCRFVQDEVGRIRWEVSWVATCTFDQRSDLF